MTKAKTMPTCGVKYLYQNICVIKFLDRVISLLHHDIWKTNKNQR